MDNTIITFKVGPEMREYLQKKENVSAYLRSLIYLEMRGGAVETECPFCEYLRRWGTKKGSGKGGLVKA